jgi:rod shape-determining protein MreC
MYDTKTGLKTAMVILGLVVSLMLVLFSKIGIFTSVYPAFKQIFGNFQINNLQFFQEFKNNWDFIGEIAKYKNENEQLREANLTLNTDYAKALITIQDLQTINRQMGFDLKYQLEPVRIVKYADSQTEVFLNKGTDSKIKVDDILILDDNLVGVIIESSTNLSRARLIISSDSKIPVIVLEAKAKGIATGTNSSVLNLKELPNNVVLLPGNNVVTAGTDGVIPYGLVVGQVESVSSDQTKITQEALIKSKIRFNDLRDLFVIIK